MNKGIKYITIIFLLLAMLSCKESFLDQGLLGEVEETDFMKSESDALLATNAVYNVLREWRYHGGFPVIDILSDDATKGSSPSDGIQLVEIEEFTFTADHPEISGWYTTLYQGIIRANLVIEKAPEIQMDETYKNRLISEARFIRALTYFTMVRVYGGVPIVTTINPERLLTRNTSTEVYALIKEDLLFAISNLPEKSDYPSGDLGRATKGAAKGLLAKVYLFEGDLVNAEKYALEVINSGQYSLDPDFTHAISKNGEFGPGSIFEIGATAEGFAQGGNQYGNTQGVRSLPNRGWGFNRPSWNLLRSFESGDPRREATVLFLGEEINGVTIEGDASTPDTTYRNGVIYEIECYNQKAWVPGTGPLESWDANIRVLRYADVLLIAAEALNENGKNALALKYLNEVRERARGGNASLLPDVTETQKNNLRKLIWNERRAELAMEQHRFFDLVRTGQAASALGPLGFQTGKHELFPIPQSEIDLSEGTLTQNPGW